MLKNFHSLRNYGDQNNLRMNNEDKVNEFNQFFSSNYKYLKGFTKSIDCKADYENLLHHVYLKVRDRIETNGYNGNEYMNFTRVALMNSYKSQYRQNKKIQIIDIDDEDFTNHIETILVNQEELLQQDQLIQAEISYIINGIYEYVEKYFNQKELFVFRTYYLLKHKHLNYKQLSEATGYSVTSVSNIIKRIKKELRQNLKIYLKTGSKMEELQKEIEALLQKDIYKHFNDYKTMYLKIYGRCWAGCKCHKPALKQEIINWYEQNKQK